VAEQPKQQANLAEFSLASLYTLLPLALGSLGGALWTGQKALLSLSILGFALSLGSGLGAYSFHIPAKAREQVYTLYALGLALGGSVLAFPLLNRAPLWQAAGGLGFLGGLAALILRHIQDWRRIQNPQGRLALLLTPWFEAYTYGALSNWAFSRLGKDLQPQDQRLLSSVVLTLVLAWLVSARWRRAGLGNQAQLSSSRLGSRFHGLVSWSVWGGRLAAAGCLILTITGEGAIFAVLGWFFALIGEGAWNSLVVTFEKERWEKE